MEVYYCLFLIVLATGLLLRPRATVVEPEEGLLPDDAAAGEITYTQPKRAKFFLLFAFLLIGIVIGFRHLTVGADTQNYLTLYFNDVRKNGVIGDNPEIVIRLIAWFCQLFSKEYQVYLIVTGFLTAFLFGKWIYDNSHNVFISTIIFLGMFFVQSLNLMREWLAIAFIINADTFFRNKKFVPFTIFLLLGIFCHMTAAAYLAVVLLGGIKRKRLAFFITLIGCILFYLVRNQVFDLVVKIFPRYDSYVNSSLFINETNFNAKDVIFLFILGVFLLALVFRKEAFTEEEYNRYYTYSLLLVLALTFSLCGQSFYMLHRVVFYYSVFLIVSIPNFINKIKGGWIIYLVLIPAMFFMLYRNSSFDNNVISHYHWFWEKVTTA